jgi:prepilin-type N-terminal cleavage/methylation domain-containing protein
MKIKKRAFTLAEVLITLGVIGVVAAMTIPTLMANVNGAKYRTQFKKDLSTLSQAAKMGLAQYDMDYASANFACAYSGGNSMAKQHPDEDPTFCAILNATLAGKTYGSIIDLKTKDDKSYYSSVKRTTLKSFALYPYSYTLSDGSIVGLHYSAAKCSLPTGTPLDSTWINANANCVGFIDVNGTSYPNKEVTCTNTEETALSPDIPCTVKNDGTHLTDIYPIVFHDAVVEPASNAAKYILSTTK